VLRDNTSSLLARLDELKTEFTPAGAQRVGRLLTQLARKKLTDTDLLVLYHELLLFLRAYPHNASIARAVIAMAHSLGLRVVAEGVETDAQRLFLWRNACDELQGYLCSPPVPLADFTQLLRRRRHLEPQVA